MHGSLRADLLLRQYGIPVRLASALIEDHGVDDKVIAQLRKPTLRALVDGLVDYELQCTGHEGYAKVVSRRTMLPCDHRKLWTRIASQVHADCKLNASLDSATFHAGGGDRRRGEAE